MQQLQKTICQAHRGAMKFEMNIVQKHIIDKN